MRFVYLYRAPEAELSFILAEHVARTGPAKTVATFLRAEDAYAFVDYLETNGQPVSILPSALPQNQA